MTRTPFEQILLINSVSSNDEPKLAFTSRGLSYYETPTLAANFDPLFSLCHTNLDNPQSQSNYPIRDSSFTMRTY